MTSKEYWGIKDIISEAAHYALQNYKTAASLLDECSEDACSPEKSIADAYKELAKTESKIAETYLEKYQWICHLQDTFLLYEHQIVNDYYI